ncbi:hypothetical protein MTBBW1_420048 [Desulfamplus magnetovallimortis]|uniref:Uncharacterized protein n=1 Tax=Desulfamplus magnetovallimortis TaxID=1246637 RepID=A0A1W1HH78_9BACT|nr:hypothetical protein MTBBW1_420048 [Desulfamplus magnetovallimortis]
MLHPYILCVMENQFKYAAIKNSVRRFITVIDHPSVTMSHESLYISICYGGFPINPNDRDGITTNHESPLEP